SVLEPNIYIGTSVPSAIVALTGELLFSEEKYFWIFFISTGNECAACIKSDRIAWAVCGSVPGALPRPKSILLGYKCAKVPNCSAIIRGEWLGSIIPPEPTLMLLVFSATYPISREVALLPILSEL